MPDSPLNESTGLVTFEILLGGKPIKDTVEVLSIKTINTVGRTPEAIIEFLLPSGKGGNNPFALSEDKNYRPGAAIEIKLGYNTKNKTIFKGIALGHGVKAKRDSRPIVQLRCGVKVDKLTVGTKTKAFSKKKDSEIIEAILLKAGLEKSVEATGYEHPQLLQIRQTDWGFITERAAANGLIVYLEDEKVQVKKPAVSGTVELEVSFGGGVFEFEGDIDASWQFPSATAKGWDFATGKETEGGSAEPRLNKQGNISGKKLSEALGLEPATFSSTIPEEASVLKTFASATLLQSRLSAQRGRIVFIGKASPTLNTLIEIKGFGDRFNGNALITSVRHQVVDGTWETEVGYGLPPSWAVSQAEKPSTRLNTRINGLQNGTVTKITEDPAKKYRVEVDVPMLGSKIWARPATFYATAGQGAFFLPEIGDEVVLGFLDDDPRFGILLGSLPGPMHKPAYEADDQKSIKALTTKAQLKLEMNDDKRAFTLATPGKNTIVISDEDKAITITDEHKNVITMDAGGITLKSSKDIVLNAGGKISLKANSEIEANSSRGNVSLTGLHVSGVGKIGLVMKGGGRAELSASGQTTIKGAMVRIN